MRTSLGGCEPQVQRHPASLFVGLPFGRFRYSLYEVNADERQLGAPNGKPVFSAIVELNDTYPRYLT